MKRTLLLLVSVLGLGLSAACAPAPGASSLVYGLTLAPSGIDPHINASAELSIPLSSVYDTLIFQDPASGAFVPGLAKSWSVSPDGLIYSFELRQDVVFHDGTPFNAEAVAANLEYVLNPDHHSQKAIFMLGPLAEVRIMDEFSVELHLKSPFAPLLDSLAQAYLGMASPTALETWGPVDYQFHQVGSGPYRFVEYIPNDHLTLERFEDYDWAPEIYRARKASIETITFKFFADPATRALALESGEVDLIGELPPYDAARLEQSENFTLHPVAIPGQPLQFFFNTRLSPTDDPLVRQALLSALDRQQIVDTVFAGLSPVASGLLSGVTSGYAPLESGMQLDPDLAAALLEQSGWLLDPATQLRQKDGNTLELTIIAPAWGSNSEVAQLLRAAWEELGAKVLVEVAPGFGPLREKQSAGNYHLIGLNFFGTDPDLLTQFLQSGGLYNWSGVADAAIDELLASGRTNLDPAARALIYQQLAGALDEQTIVIPIRDYTNMVVANSKLQGLRFSYQGWAPLLHDLSLRR